MAGLALIVGQGEGRVLQQFDVAVDELRLAASALAFLAAVHKRDALPKRRVEHGLAFLDFHLDAHRLESNLVNLRIRHLLDPVMRQWTACPDRLACPEVKGSRLGGSLSVSIISGKD